MLTQEQITKYQQIHLQVFGTDVSCDEAAPKGELLLATVRRLYKPIKKSDLETATSYIRHLRDSHGK